MSAEGLMLEAKSRLSILVVEDNRKNIENAVLGLRGHDVVVAKTMMEVTDSVIKKKFDYILSDVRFPYAQGHKPIAIISEILTIAFQADSPVVFLMNENSGILQKPGIRSVMLKACSISDASATLMHISRHKKSSEEELFKTLRFSRYEVVAADCKTPEVWKTALDMIRNVNANPDQMDRLIRKVKGSGLGVEIKDGTMHVVATKGSKIKMR